MQDGGCILPESCKVESLQKILTSLTVESVTPTDLNQWKITTTPIPVKPGTGCTHSIAGDVPMHPETSTYGEYVKILIESYNTHPFTGSITIKTVEEYQFHTEYVYDTARLLLNNPAFIGRFYITDRYNLNKSDNKLVPCSDVSVIDSKTFVIKGFEECEYAVTYETMENPVYWTMVNLFNQDVLITHPLNYVDPWYNGTLSADGEVLNYYWTHSFPTMMYLDNPILIDSMGYSDTYKRQVITTHEPHNLRVNDIVGRTDYPRPTNHPYNLIRDHHVEQVLDDYTYVSNIQEVIAPYESAYAYSEAARYTVKPPYSNHLWFERISILGFAMIPQDNEVVIRFYMQHSLTLDNLYSSYLPHTPNLFIKLATIYDSLGHCPERAVRVKRIVKEETGTWKAFIPASEMKLIPERRYIDSSQRPNHLNFFSERADCSNCVFNDSMIGVEVKGVSSVQFSNPDVPDNVDFTKVYNIVSFDYEVVSDMWVELRFHSDEALPSSFNLYLISEGGIIAATSLDDLIVDRRIEGNTLILTYRYAIPNWTYPIDEIVYYYSVFKYIKCGYSSYVGYGNGNDATLQIRLLTSVPLLQELQLQAPSDYYYYLSPLVPHVLRVFYYNSDPVNGDYVVVPEVHSIGGLEGAILPPASNVYDLVTQDKRALNHPFNTRMDINKLYKVRQLYWGNIIAESPEYLKTDCNYNKAKQETASNVLSLSAPWLSLDKDNNRIIIKTPFDHELTSGDSVRIRGITITDSSAHTICPVTVQDNALIFGHPPEGATHETGVPQPGYETCLDLTSAPIGCSIVDVIDAVTFSIGYSMCNKTSWGRYPIASEGEFLLFFPGVNASSYRSIPVDGSSIKMEFAINDKFFIYPNTVIDTIIEFDNQLPSIDLFCSPIYSKVLNLKSYEGQTLNLINLILAPQ